MEKQYVCLVKADGVTGLLMTRVTEGGKDIWNIHGFESKMDGIRYFEDAYNRNHGRSYEASMSALINAISFRPSILQLSIPEIERMMPEKAVVTVRNVSGRMTLLPLDPEKANSFWDAGVKPDLISRIG